MVSAFFLITLIVDFFVILFLDVNTAMFGGPSVIPYIICALPPAVFFAVGLVLAASRVLQSQLLRALALIPLLINWLVILLDIWFYRMRGH